MQIVLWHDATNGRNMRWSHSMREDEAPAVDIAAQVKQSLAKANENNGED